MKPKTTPPTLAQLRDALNESHFSAMYFGEEYAYALRQAIAKRKRDAKRKVVKWRLVRVGEHVEIGDEYSSDGKYWSEIVSRVGPSLPLDPGGAGCYRTRRARGSR